MRIIGRMTAALGALALAGAGASAAVDHVGEAGFAISETAHVAAPPERVYATLITPSRWWSPAHTFSHDAANLALDAKAGGCWCETLPGGGSVLHMSVVYASPGKLLRLRGALGPFQGMGADGALTVSLKPNGGGTDVAMIYALGGYAPDGFGDLAKAVDFVLGEQLDRLKRSIETGSPDVANPDSATSTHR
ncbi:MAG: SRPBCC domain-containing protein [Rhizomicrobium sp.]|jgi:uncharacterized protein YndB with AHSA1/START domain